METICKGSGKICLAFTDDGGNFPLQRSESVKSETDTVMELKTVVAQSSQIEPE